MSDFKHKKNVLIFACGNPSRGDDALGPLFLNRLELQIRQLPDADQIELLTDFQFQVEHAIDLQNRERIVFVDASLTAKPPFEFEQIYAEKDISYTTHSMSPQAVIDVYEQMYHESPAPSYLLSIKGESFELGEALSSTAEVHLEKALKFITQFLT